MNYSKFFIGLFILITSICLGSNEEILVKEYTPLEEIIANGQTCIRDFEENKIYLREDKIFVTEKGLFLALNDQEYVHIPKLRSDARGCFLKIPSPSHNFNTGIQIFNKCPSCGQSYYFKCRNVTCSSNQPKSK